MYMYIKPELEFIIVTYEILGTNHDTVQHHIQLCIIVSTNNLGIKYNNTITFHNIDVHMYSSMVIIYYRSWFLGWKNKARIKIQSLQHPICERVILSKLLAAYKNIL